MKELKVGERVTITLEAVEAIKSKRCDGCFFDRNGGCVAISLGMECVPKYRSDKKNVIFKEVKKQKRKMKEDKHSLKISRSCGNYNEGAIYFKNKEDAQAVIDNPNFRSILDAIYKD